MRSDKSGSQLVDSLDNELRGAVLEGVVLVKVNMGTGLLVREVGEDVSQRKQARTVGGDAYRPVARWVRRCQSRIYVYAGLDHAIGVGAVWPATKHQHVRPRSSTVCAGSIRSIVRSPFVHLNESMSTLTRQLFDIFGANCLWASSAQVSPLQPSD